MLWVEPYATRLPRLSDFNRRQKKVAHTQAKQPPWLQVVKVPSLPIEPIPFVRESSRLLWGPIRGAIHRFTVPSCTVVVVGKPSRVAVDSLARYKNVPSIYDAMDDFPSFYRGVSAISMRRCEEKIAEAVDCVWTSSTVLFNRIRHRHRNVEFIGNALDADLATGIRRTSSVSGKKIFGYVGTVAAWFDWTWLINLARARPADEVRIIGPVFSRVPGPLPPNVRLLPACSHREALRQMGNFDVGLIPFLNCPLTASVDPIKYYEYRALGLPVLSSDFGEMSLRRNERGVFLATSDTLELAAKEALQFADDERDRRAFVDSNSWERRFESSRFLADLIAKRTA